MKFGIVMVMVWCRCNYISEGGVIIEGFGEKLGVIVNGFFVFMKVLLMGILLFFCWDLL